MSQDLRLLLPAVACWAGAYLGWHIWLAAVAVGVALRWRTPVVAAGAACLLGGALVMALRQEAVRTGPLPRLARVGATVTVDVVLDTDPRPLASQHGQRLFLVTGRAERVATGGERWRLRAPVLLLARGGSWAPLLPSTRVRVTGKAKPAQAGDAVAAVVFPSGVPLVLHGPSRLQRAAGSLRGGLRSASARLPGGADGLLPGLVIGDTSRLSAADQADFRADGLTHIVAVSGTNVTAVLTGVLSLTGLMGLRRRHSALVAGVSLLAFVVVARPSASVVRAAVMGWVSLAAWVGGRQRTAAGTLAAAVIVLLLVDPALARSAGFALSVLACTGLLFLAPGWRDALVRRGWSAQWAEALAVPAAAQVACTPVIAGIGGGVSLVAIPANLLAAPAVASATTLGVLTALAAAVWMPLAHLLAVLAAGPTLWLLGVAHACAVVPGATVPWAVGTEGAVTSAAVSAVALYAARRTLVRRRSARRRTPRPLRR